jgi:hypothetical protein
MKAEIIRLAIAEVGTKESPANSNMNKYGEWYGKNGVAWCAQFVSYIMFIAGVKWPVNIETPKGFLWVRTLLIRAQQQKWITAVPELGDIVLLDWNKDKDPDHVGFFICWLIEGINFITIEGNTSDKGNQSNGGEVMIKVRFVVDVEAFVKIPQ